MLLGLRWFEGNAWHIEQCLVFVGTLSGSNISGLYEVYRGAARVTSGSLALYKRYLLPFSSYFLDA
jgi:hypothetical protein